MTLTENLRILAEQGHADLFGVADLSAAAGFIRAQGGPDLHPYPRAVSIGIHLFNSIVDRLPEQTRAACVAYKHHCYDMINQRLDLLISTMASHLQRLGHTVLPVPASKRVDDDRICGIFSHKLAAHLAGLGWIGKNCLLITPEMGPRLRLATLLTDAPLDTHTSSVPDGCGDCRRCVDACPVKAFTGEPFRAGDPREIRYDAARCQAYFRAMQAQHDWAFCGLCVAACPRGRPE